MSTDRHIDPEEARAFYEVSPMSSGERLWISDHAAGCPGCRALLRSAAGNHPSIDRKRTINDLQTMAAAARLAEQREHDELAAFVSGLDAFPQEEFVPGGTLPAPAQIRANRQPSIHVHPVRSWWKSLFLQPAPWTAAAAGIAVIAVLGVSSFSRQVGLSAPLLRDGPLVVVADGTLRGVGSLPDDLRATVAKIVRERGVYLADAALGKMRGDNATPRVSNPSNSAPLQPLQPPAGSVVEDARPTLRWKGVPGAKGYTIEISSLTTDAVVASTSLSPTVSWRPDNVLLRGTIYRWTVRAFADPHGQPFAASATLKVLGAADEERLRRLRTEFQKSHLVLAAAYLRLNLKQEAKVELQALQDANPHSMLVREIVDSLP